MIKKYLYLLVVGFSILTMYSCGTTMNLGSRVKQLELGMDKKEAVKILGTSYTVMGAASTNEGNVETIKYSSTLDNDAYFVRFLNGKLVEWFIEPDANAPKRRHPHPVE